MNLKRFAKWLFAGAGALAAGYAGYVALTWFRYGHPNRSRTADESDPLLDRFMPVYDVVERHSVRVAAPADITFSSAADLDLQRSRPVRSIFKIRELCLGSKPDDRKLPRTLLGQTMALGWGMLAELPNREVVMGAVTQPWLAHVVFTALTPGEFLSFAEPNYVKIVWTLRADPTGDRQSIFHTETRAIGTDESARAKFRVYWSVFQRACG